MVELAVSASKILLAITVIITSNVQTENMNRRHERAVASSSTQDDRNQNNTGALNTNILQQLNTNGLNNQSTTTNTQNTTTTNAQNTTSTTKTGPASSHRTTHLTTRTTKRAEPKPSGNPPEDEDKASQNKQENVSTQKTLTSTTGQSVTVWLIAVGVSLPLALLVSLVIYRAIVTQRPVYQVQEICLPGYDRKREKQLEELLLKYGGKDGADTAEQQKNGKPNVKPLNPERKRATKSKTTKGNRQADEALLVDSAVTCMNVNTDDYTCLDINEE